MQAAVRVAGRFGCWLRTGAEALAGTGAQVPGGRQACEPSTDLISRDETVLRLTDPSPWTTVDYVFGAHFIVLARRADT
jgi:hypothetical protein